MQYIITFVISMMTGLLVMSPALAANDPSSPGAGNYETTDKAHSQLYSQTGSKASPIGGVTSQTDGVTNRPVLKVTKTGGNTTIGNPSTVPEINAAAAPTALALLVGGLLLFRERSRHARQTGGQSRYKPTGLIV